MTSVEHLEEVRRRLLFCVAAVMVGTAVAFLVAYFLLAFGLTFELPLVLTGLVVMGIVSPDTLRTHRTSILVALWTASCFITPGADPYSPLILGVAFTVLFFVSTGLIRLVGQVSTGEAIQIASPGVVEGTDGAVERLT